MDVIMKQLRKKDFNMAREFAIDGMHLNWYASNKLELYFYSKYFWYLEISKATKAFGAYLGDKLIGVILADINEEPKIFTSRYIRLYVKIISFFINLFYKDASNTYDDANMEMLNEFKKKNKIDGEINFFAVDPSIKGKGIGTLLLNQLEKKEKGKLIYLFTDSGSTYPFYLHRGFKESGKREIKMKINKKEVSLTCFLFSKKF